MAFAITSNCSSAFFLCSLHRASTVDTMADPPSPRSSRQPLLPQDRPTAPTPNPASYGNTNTNTNATPPNPNPSPVTPATIPSFTPVFAPQPPPRASLSSMLFLTAFFFLMSGGNQPNIQEISVGPDGKFVQRVTELDLARQIGQEYEAWRNGTAGNWTEVRLRCGRQYSLMSRKLTRKCSHLPLVFWLHP